MARSARGTPQWPRLVRLRARCGPVGARRGRFACRRPGAAPPPRPPEAAPDPASGRETWRRSHRHLTAAVGADATVRPGGPGRTGVGRSWACGGRERPDRPRTLTRASASRPPTASATPAHASAGLGTGTTRPGASRRARTRPRRSARGRVLPSAGPHGGRRVGTPARLSRRGARRRTRRSPRRTRRRVGGSRRTRGCSRAGRARPPSARTTRSPRGSSGSRRGRPRRRGRR